MITKYFKCKLLSDVVVNASLATEGNMQTLDYIPGSSFLGIAAKEYNSFDDDAYQVFHSGKVSFGDALISKDSALSYKVPFSLYLDKLNKEITKDKVWVQTKLAEFKKEEMPKDKCGDFIQLKQHRDGYLDTNKYYISNIEKEFSLKSAYNPSERRSYDGKMFGFEALKAGQEFIFSVIFEDEKYVEKVTTALVGEKHIGKSKTAQYGLVEIEQIETPSRFKSKPIKDNQLVVYAESNLCFLNEFGQPTFQPDYLDFGLPSGKINWEKSQIRTYSYSPWNTTRNSTDTQRDVILRGSVIVFEDIPSDLDVNQLPKMVGEYRNEGLGRVIYNPEFLNYKKDATWDFELNREKIEEHKKIKELSLDDQIKLIERKIETVDNSEVKSDIGKILKEKFKEVNNELLIGLNILKTLRSEERDALLDKKITKSQWGEIRKRAVHAKNMDTLWEELFEPKEGYLVHGVAAEKIWDKNRGKSRKALRRIIKQNKELGTKFVAKLAAEIVKKH